MKITKLMYELFVLAFLLSGCVLTTAPSPPPAASLMKESDAVDCVRRVLNNEIKHGTSEEFDPVQDFETPVRECWLALGLNGRRAYAGVLVDPAIDHGIASVLIDACPVLINQHLTSITAKKCEILIKHGLLSNQEN